MEATCPFCVKDDADDTYVAEQPHPGKILSDLKQHTRQEHPSKWEQYQDEIHGEA